MAHSTRFFAMRMNDHMSPRGMAKGKLTMTISSANSQPENTAGTEVTAMLGSKNRCRNFTLFHACTAGCSDSHTDNCSAAEVPTTVMVLPSSGMSRVVPSAKV